MAIFVAHHGHTCDTDGDHCGEYIKNTPLNAARENHMNPLFPTTMITLLEHVVPLFTASHFFYFRGVVLAMMLLGHTRKCVTNIGRVCFFVERHISSWERFLSQSHWELPGIQTRVIRLVQEQFGDKLLVHGAYLGWVDTTLVAKVKGAMRGVQKWHDHSGNPDRGKSLVGHHWALVGLVCSTMLAGTLTTLCWPFLARLISGHADPLGDVVTAQGVAKVMNFWETVCPLLAHLHTLLGGCPMRVVADAYVAKAPFLTWMLSLGIHVMTRMRHDAVGWDDPSPEPPRASGKKKPGPKRTKPQPGTHWKLATLLNMLPHETITLRLYGTLETLHVVTRDLWIRGVESQKVRVVVVQTRGRPVILLSTDLSLPPVAIVDSYGLRFPAELAIRNLKQFFGLGDYQCTGLLAITRFVGLSVISYCLWQVVQVKDSEAAWLQIQEAARTRFSFARLSQAVRRLTVGKLFAKSVCDGNVQNNGEAADHLNRLFV